jgi:allantoin racemase
MSDQDCQLEPLPICRLQFQHIREQGEKLEDSIKEEFFKLHKKLENGMTANVTALMAVREMTGLPTVGMTEAAIVTAQLLGTRFGLVVFGTPVVYRELVAAQGFADRFAGLRSIDMAATAAFTTPEAVNDRVVEAAIRLAEDDGAECVVLCGAAMAGMARRLQSRVPVPLVDGIACGVPLLEMLVRMGVPAPTAGSLAPPTGRATTGLSPALARRLMGG